MYTTTRLGLCAISLSLLGACATYDGSGIGDNDTERAVIGAVAGGIAAEATDNDPALGAAAGAAAGVFCDDAGICRPSR